MSRPPSPLVIARHGRPTTSVVVCHDGSAHAQAAVEALCRMPWIHGLHVTVVAIDDGRSSPGVGFDAAEAALDAAGADVHRRLLAGDPTSRLRHFLRDHPADLVVLGTRGLSGLDHLRVGSTATAIARSTEDSVLVARQG